MIQYTLRKEVASDGDISKTHRTPARIAAALCLLTFSSPLAYSFCGFYVAKADTKLFNKASQVVLVRHEDKTVLTMANDYQGDPKEFAIVIPVPTFLQREQIHVGEKALIDRFAEDGKNHGSLSKVKMSSVEQPKTRAKTSASGRLGT